MGISSNKIIGAALAVSAMLAGVSAHADVDLSNSGNGELVLFVKNTTTGVVYARGLGINVDNVLGTSAITAGGYSGPSDDFTYSMPSIGPDANLTSFLNGTDSFAWTVMAGDSTGGIALGDKRYVTTSQMDLRTNGTNITGTQLATSWNNLQAMLTTLNGFLPDVEGSSVSSLGQWWQTGASPGASANSWYGTSVNNVNALGQAAGFFVLSTNGTGGTTNLYANTFGLQLDANGTLHAVGSAPEVPLPAAAWLLGSGLLGLLGVGRRKVARA